MNGARGSASRLGPYRLGTRLGVGGMAEVFVAERDDASGRARRFAIKRILPQLARDVRFVAMFCDEARISAMLEHPNIVQVLDFGESAGELFMAMEYVDGVSLARLLRAAAARNMTIPLKVGLFIAEELLRALGYAHEACDTGGHPLGIVHRDVSPGNVLVGRRGEVKLTDFGIVRSAFVDRRTYPGELKGKMGYMSPEQVLGHDVDPRSDLFTLGIVLAELLLMRPLFSGRDEVETLTAIHRVDLGVLERHGHWIPMRLQSVLRRLLARAPSDRYDTARDALDDLGVLSRAQRPPPTPVDLVEFLERLRILAEPPGADSGVTPGFASPGPSVHEASTRRLPERAVATEPGGRPAPLRKVTPQTFRAPPGAAATPVDIDSVTLLEWAATGRFGLRTLVQGPHGWQPADTVKGLELLHRDAYRFGDPPAEGSAVRRAALPEALYALALQGAGGVLVARGAYGERRVYYEDGVAVFVSSTDSGELLGERLVAAGMLDRGTVENALRLSFKEQRRLGEVLLRNSRLQPSLLLRALIEQLEARFEALGRLREGTFQLVLGRVPGEHLPRSPREALSMVTRLVRQAYAAEEIQAWLVACGARRLVAGPAAPVDSVRLGLMQSERRALELAPGAGDWRGLLDELVGERIATRAEALRAIFVGLSLGLLETEGWPPLPPIAVSGSV